MSKYLREYRDFDEYYSIPQIRTEYKKVGSRWVKVGEEKELLTEKQYNNSISPDWTRLMRSFGGYENQKKGYTMRGYKVVERTSISPDRTTKYVTRFDLNDKETYEGAIAEYHKQFRKK